MSVSSAQVTFLLENILFEQPSLAAANTASWVAMTSAASPDTSLSSVEAAISGAAEASIPAEVVRLYAGALGRTPTAAEVQYYVTVAEAGLSAAQIAQGASAVSSQTWQQIATYFTLAPEFRLATDGIDVVSMLYQNILERVPSAAEKAYYDAQLASGAPLATLLLEFVNSPEYLHDIQFQIPGLLSNYAAAVLTGNPAVVAPLTQTFTSAGNVVLTGGIGGSGGGGTFGGFPIGSIVGFAANIGSNDSAPLVLPAPVTVSSSGTITVLDQTALQVQVTSNVVLSISDTSPYDRLSDLVLTGSAPLTLANLYDDVPYITIDAHTYQGVLTIGSASSPLSQPLLRIEGGIGTNVITVSGAENEIICPATAGGSSVVDSGVGSIVTLEDTGGVNSVTAKSTMTVTVGTGQDTVTATSVLSQISVGASDTGMTSVTAGQDCTITLAGGNSAADIVFPGGNSTVVLTAAAGSGGVKIVLSAGNEAGASAYDGNGASGGSDVSFLNIPTLTKLSSTSGFADVTVQFVAGTTGVDHVAGSVDVSGLSSLTQALNHAAQLSAGGAATVSGDSYFSWFQFQGTTYILDHAGAGTKSDALGASDQVVALTGSVDPTQFVSISGGSHILLL